MKKQPVFETILGLKLRLPEERVLKTKDFFCSRVRKSKKMAVFWLPTFELTQMLRNKRKNAISRRFVFNGWTGCAIHELKMLQY